MIIIVHCRQLSTPLRMCDVETYSAVLSRIESNNRFTQIESSITILPPKKLVEHWFLEHHCFRAPAAAGWSHRR